jgi:hypothetical protein
VLEPFSPFAGAAVFISPLPTSRSCAAPVTLDGVTILDLRNRYQRLDKPSRGLAKEAWLFRIGAGNDPMLYLERNAYREAIADARAGEHQQSPICVSRLHGRA